MRYFRVLGPLQVSLVASLCLIVSACAVKPSAWLEKGKTAAAAGKYAEAEIDDLKATQAKPDYGEGWYALGLAQFRQGHLGDALASMTKASQLLPVSRQDVAVSLAEVSMAIYVASPERSAAQYQQLATTAAELLKRDAGSYDGLRLKGFVLMIDRHYPEARDLLRKADSIKPGQEDVTQALMQCLIRNDQGPEAEKIGLSFLPGHKEAIAIYDQLYGYYMANHRTGDAEKILKRKIASMPTQLPFQLQLARHYLDAKDEAALAEVLKHVLADSKNFPDAALDVGDFYNLNNRADDALRIFQAGVAQNGRQKVAYQLRAANTMASTGRQSQAVAVLNDILKGDPQNVDARTLLATLRLATGKPDDYQSAFSDLVQLVKERPKDATIQYYLGRAYLIKGNTEAALTSFQEALRLNPRLVQARVLAADASMRRGDYVGAARYSDQVVAQTGGSPAGQMLRAEALTGMGSFDEASRAVSQLNREFPTATEPRLQMAALRLQQRRYPEAEGLYRAIYLANRKDLRALQGLVDAMEAQEHYDAAIQLLNQEKAVPGAPVDQLNAILAEAALRGHKLDIAVQQYSLLIGANPDSAVDHLKLGDALLQKGDTQQAISEFQTAQKLDSKDATALIMLAQSLSRVGRTSDAERAYREALGLQPKNAFVKNNLAYLLSEQGGNLDEALRLAQEAAQQQPDSAALADTLAYVYIKKSLPDSAIQILTNLIRKDSDQSIYHYHLAMALLQRGDKAGARREGEESIAKGLAKGDETRIRELLAGLH